MHIAESEWQVMEVLWRRSPLETTEVVDALAETSHWSPSTIKTLLHRLTKKGAVSIEPVANRFRYRPTLAREDALRMASGSFVERFFAGQTVPMLLHFARAGRLKPKDIEDLKRILEAEQKKASERGGK